MIGSLLDPQEEQSLIDFLKKNQDVFAWSPSEMPGIDPKVMSHKLKVDPSFKPVRQKQRKISSQHIEAIKEEISKLKKAGSIREVQHPEWLANTVVVKKKNGKWRVCVDYTDLNKACPKDSFPFPVIDRLVDSTAGSARMSLLDAYSGYNQIPMHKEDQEKTAFITPYGLYCYIVMPFGLKNAGATFQRLVTIMFSPLLGKTMEVYIDDMLVKSKEKEDHLKDLEATFKILREYKMKLNASKCSFGVSSGKFLGAIVSRRGIEADPSQIQALRELKNPTTVREVQRLTGMVASWL